MFQKQWVLTAMVIVTAVVVYMIFFKDKTTAATVDIGNPTIKQGVATTVSAVEGVISNVGKAWGSLFGKKGPAVVDASQKALDEAPYYIA